MRLALTFFLIPLVAAPDTLAEIRHRGALRWGADREGGGPFVYPRDDDPSQVAGFEVDLAQVLARSLGVRSEFCQGDWSAMPEMLNASKVDIVLNGYEWSPERARGMETSIPYYVYGLQLMARTGVGDLRSWDDLGRPRGDAKRKVGVLIGSAAEKYLKDRFGGAIDLIGYSGNTDAMREVETGKLDATLQDTPIVAFYLSRFPRLQKIGEPVAGGYYVILARKGEKALVRALNASIIRALRSGELERIYRRYGIWDDAQKELAQFVDQSKFYGYADEVFERVERVSGEEPTVEVGARRHGWDVVRGYGWVMLQSAGMTVILSALSFPLAVIVGILVAIGRLYGARWIRIPLAAYVEFLRGTPVMLQLFFIFFFLPEVGITVPAFWTAVLGLAINYSAYESEIYRAGLQAVPTGQMEAALSLGMSKTLALRRIIVPQAFRIVIPPIVNDFIALFKDTSVCSVVTIVELTKQFSVLSQSTQSTVELMGMTAVLYLLMSYPLSIVSRRLERRLAREAHA